MNDTVIVALCSLVGTFGGILSSNRLTNHRIQDLEKKVDKHNSIVERTYILEGKVSEAQHEIRDLKMKG